MSTLQSLDIQARGVVAVSDAWRADHDELRGLIWPLEDIVSQFLSVFDSAFELYEQFRKESSFERILPALTHFARVLKTSLRGASDVVESAERLPAQSYDVRGIAALKQRIEQARDLLENIEDIVDSELAKQEGPSRPFAEICRELGL